MAIKYLSMTELENGKPNDPIWVLNTASNSEIGASGEVHISIPKINGSKTDPLHIPQTWLAVEITRSIPRNQLLHASEFRTAIDNQLIQPISAKSAEEINNQDGADEERARLAEFKRHIRKSGAARTIGKGIGEITMVSAGANSEASEEEDEAPKKRVALSASFMMFADLLKNKPDLAALNDIRNRRTYSRRELLHLKKIVSDKPKSYAAITKQLDSARKPSAE